MEQSTQELQSQERLPDVLASTVARITDSDVDGLTPTELLEVIARAEAIKASAAALQARATVRFVDEQDADADAAAARGQASAREVAGKRRAARSQVALARRCSPTQGSRHVGLARALASELPETMAALTRGEVSEWRATIVAKETACLDPHDRREADRRLAPDLTRMGDRAVGDAARRACLDLDAESVVRRRSRAVASRSVTVRPAPDGMAWLSILGRMADVVGAHASLMAGEKARFVATGDPVADRARAEDDRSRGAWMADTALERLSGRTEGQAQPVEVNLVMDESALFPAQADARHSGCADDGSGECTSTHHEEGWAEMPGWGAVPASMAREHLLRMLGEDDPRQQGRPEGDEESPPGSGRAGFWLRRLWASPDGRDLVGMDSRRRFFGGGLRRLLELRDPRCRVPWCDAPARQVDHIHSAGEGGATSAANGAGLCQCHNLVKEEPGWSAEVVSTGLDPGEGPHEMRLTTPTGVTHDCPAPPLFGSGRPPRADTSWGRGHVGSGGQGPQRSRLEIIYEGVLHAA